MDKEERTVSGGCIGGIAGMAAGISAAIWGGYEVGTAINDALDVSSFVGRGTLDLAVIAGLGIFTVPTGTFLGGISGGVIGRYLGSRDSIINYDDIKYSKEDKKRIQRLAHGYKRDKTLN